MKTPIRLGSLALAALFVASACSSAATPSPSASTVASAPPASASATTQPSSAPAGLSGSLTIWDAYASGGSAEGTAFKKVIDQVKAANPNLQLTVLDVPFDQLFKKYETETAAGGGPDMFIAPNDSYGSEIRASLLADITDKVSGKFDQDLQVAKDGVTYSGKVYSVPESLKAVALFYDKSKVATPPATTDDLLAAVKAGTLKIAINQNVYHNFGFWPAFGGKLLDDSGKCVADQGGFADAFKYLADLKAAGANFYTDGNQADDAFATGKVQAIIEGPWKTGDFKTALKDNLAVAPIPAGPKGPAAPLTGVDGWYFNPNSQNLGLAVQLGLLLVSQPNEQVMVDEAGHIPADPTITVADPITQAFGTAVKDGTPRPQVKELDNYWGNFGDALNKVLTTKLDPTKAVADACAAMNKANGH